MWNVEIKSGARFIKVSNSRKESFPSEKDNLIKYFCAK